MSVSMDNLIQEGDAAFERKDYPRAVELFTRVVEGDPDNSDARLSLAAAYYHSGDYPLALETSLYGLEHLSGKSRFAFNAGLASNQMGDNRRAVDFYTRAIELDPMYALAYYARGNCRLFDKDYSLAEKDYLAALEYGVEYDDIHYSLGLCKEHLGKFSEALGRYEDALNIAHDTTARVRLGVCCYVLYGGASDRAEELLRQAWEEDPENLEAGAYYAACLRDRERYEDLVKHLESMGGTGNKWNSATTSS